MGIPDYEDLIEKRKLRKKEMSEFYSNMPIAKTLFKQAEIKTQNFLVTNFSMLEEVDQGLTKTTKQEIAAFGFLCLLPISIFSGYYTWKKPVIKWYFSTAIFGVFVVLPFALWANFWTFKQDWLSLYLVDKYQDRISEYEITNDPKTLNRS